MDAVPQRPNDKKRRKEEGKRLKQQKIEEGGGKRPRAAHEMESKRVGGANHHTTSASPRQKQPQQNRKQNRSDGHRFGRVMDSVPCPGKPRFSTLSIALPGSVVSNCQTRELRTQMVGQIARAATIYHVDEIVVFDDKLAKETKSGYYRRNNNNRDEQPDRRPAAKEEDGKNNEKPSEQPNQEESSRPKRSSDPHAFMARIFQYCECPQYLRRHFFPMHPDLQFSGLLAPIDAPHHVRAGDRSPFREGVVLEKSAPGGKSLVNCGIRSRPVEINMSLQPGIRCTVQLDPSVYGSTGRPKGTVVSPSAPREKDGTYWGYTTRMASSIKAALDECPYEGGYDIKIGTSERGNSSLDDSTFRLPNYQHAIIVFGGVAGIEECVDADESIKLSGSESRKLFDMWVNICPYQGSRTIRTEEAVLIALAKLSPILLSSSRTQEALKGGTKAVENAPAVELSSDSGVSSESDEASSGSESE